MQRTCFALPGLVALILFICTGCASSPFGTVSSTSNPLVAEYSIHPVKPGTVTVEFGPTEEYGFSTATVHTAVGATIIEVAGMKQRSTYHMRARADYEDGTSEEDVDHVFTTGAIPAGVIPSYTVTATPGMTPQPGVELVDTLPGATPATAFATDLEGNVIWYYPFSDVQPGLQIYPVKLLSNGDFLSLVAPNSSDPLGSVPAGSLNEMREFDLVGNVKRRLTMSTLNASLAAAGFDITLQLFSHDFAVLPNGHILVIANTFKSFTNLPGFPGTTQVLGDVVVDLDKNWRPVWLWSAFDHLDVNRHPMQFPDWTHANAIAYSPDDGNFLISMRHQHWIVKVDYRDSSGTGNVLWKLGPEGDFKLEDANDSAGWFYAQHDVNFVTSNTTGSFKLAIMDNGDNRLDPSGLACPTGGPCYSTVPIMQVDENAKTASFLFRQILPPNLYNAFAGSTRVLGNSNVEYNLAGLNNSTAQTFEVTPTETPQIVWQMSINGSNTYRSFRLPSLYPNVQW